MRPSFIVGSFIVGLLSVLLAAKAHAATDQVARGEYLTRAADCVGCHSAPGRAAWTGGREFVLPFGKVYSPNLTPDKDTGIGQYTDAEWVHMIHDGIGHGGKHLYPVMPYNSYTRVTDEDALAIKAYLFTLPAVRAEPIPNQLKFPFNQRWLMVFWNLFNNPDSRLATNTAKSPEWNRGAYLVEGLGHCAQCHTPRNFMQGLSDRAFAGAVQLGWLAYNLTSDREHGLGAWSDAQLDQYLSTGRAEGHGPASGPMAEAVSNSLRYLTQSDIHAIVVYLRDVPTRNDGPPVTPVSPTPVSYDPRGQQIFLEACAGCHLPDGKGRQSSWAGLAGSHTAGDSDGQNIVQVLTRGTQVETADGLMFMHAFDRAYTDPELAAVANYTVERFGGRDGKVTPAQIHDARPPGVPGGDRRLPPGS
jgi:mono/diheme cytochrome c family protein